MAEDRYFCRSGLPEKIERKVGRDYWCYQGRLLIQKMREEGSHNALSDADWNELRAFLNIGPFDESHKNYIMSVVKAWALERGIKRGEDVSLAQNLHKSCEDKKEATRQRG